MRMTTLAVALCLAPAPVYAQDIAEFQRIADRFVEAYSKGDLSTVLQLYAKDAYVLPPQTSMARSQEQIADVWKKEAQESEITQVSVVDAKPLGNNMAHVIFTTIGRTRGQNPQEFRGKGAALAQKVDGDWKMVVHTWNRDDRRH